MILKRERKRLGLGLGLGLVGLRVSQSRLSPSPKMVVHPPFFPRPKCDMLASHGLTFKPKKDSSIMVGYLGQVGYKVPLHHSGVEPRV